jgi:DNA repair protein RecO (recombination protein O)
MPSRERSIRTEGIVLRRQDFGEADRILRLFTRKLGKVSVIAKGVRKPSSKKSGHLEVFMRSSFLIARGRNLHILTQAEVLDSYEPLRKTLAGIGLGSYVVELVDAFTYEEGSHVNLYDLIHSTLERLSHGHSPELVLRVYELRLLDQVGFRPELFQCVECGKEITEQDQFLTGSLGGVVCPVCARSMTPDIGRRVTARELKFLRHFQRTRYRELVNLNLDSDLMAALEKSMHYYLTHILEGHLNSPDFLQRVKNASKGG